MGVPAVETMCWRQFNSLIVGVWRFCVSPKLSKGKHVLWHCIAVLLYPL